MSKIIVDGNSACAEIAYKLSECATIYPITPSSTMAEYCDKQAHDGKKNIFGDIVKVVEMQSEGGASGALHGALSGGSLATTFTSSQGLLLMIPNMYKIAGELKPCVIHVAARTVANHALSIFGDHSDVMAVRQTGFAMLSSASVQEAQDLALIAHIATLKSSVPFVHFFDGFRTSHEINTIEAIPDSVIKKILPLDKIKEFKESGLNSTHPYVQGIAQNPDVYFQNREASNSFYINVPEIVSETMKEFYRLTKRKYSLFEYYGDKKAEHLIVIMGSGSETVKKTVEFLNQTENTKYGVVCVKLFRPFSVKHFINILPKTTKTITVLDRTKENGSVGEPLYADVVQTLMEQGKTKIKVFGGVYGLASKEFTPGMVKSVFINAISENSKKHFTIGINDDVTNLSLPYSELELNSDCTTCKFYGYGGDGTVGANKSSIKIINELTGLNAQAYFEYDSKKSGNTTISSLRFGKNDVNFSFVPTKVDLVCCNNDVYLSKFDIFTGIKTNGTLLINSSRSEKEINELIKPEHKNYLIENNINVYCIDAYNIAKNLGLGNKINLIMQSAFFKLINIADFNECLKTMKVSAEINYGRKGTKVVEQNKKAIDEGYKNINKININKNIDFANNCLHCSNKNCEYYKNYIEPIEDLKGNSLPVSAFTANGKVPTNTSKLEKRGISQILPTWKSEHCIQCGLCALACPHAALRPYLFSNDLLNKFPKTLNSLEATLEPNLRFVIQVSPEDCTGCGVCASVCPAKTKAIVMTEASNIREDLDNNYNFVSSEKQSESKIFKDHTIKGCALKKPYFEFSGACAGCGETPYIKILSQLFGNHMIIANATGCSSIYGASSPTTPYAKDENGNGIAWANSLFEDNAEFGLGIKLGTEIKQEKLKTLLLKLKKKNININLNNCIEKYVNALNYEEESILRDEILKLMQENKNLINEDLYNSIINLKDAFITQSVWLIGGDGWAYDIGFGGLDHVLASGKNINILVLDTEVYSNTGGQASKSTPIGAVAKFATSGKTKVKKELGLIAKTYKDVYIAQVSLGANPTQYIKALKEAESYNGVSLIIAYAPCINHGINMANSNLEMKKAVDCGYWYLWRYNPNLIKENKNPFILDSSKPKLDFNDFINGENRFKILQNENPKLAKKLFNIAKNNSLKKYNELFDLANKK